MILICPECATRYDVDGAKFPADGRKVRCAKCGHVWHQPAPSAESVFEPEPEDEPIIQDSAPATRQIDPEPEAEPAVAPEPELESIPAHPMPFPDPDIEFEDRPVMAAAPRKRDWGGAATAAGWVALIALIFVIGWSATVWRQQMVSAWPKSASLFSHLGMKVNARGLDFADIHHADQMEDGQPVLIITGKLVNVSGEKKTVPPLRITLSDANRHAIYDWSFSAGSSSVGPGEAVSFHTRLSNPPPAAHHVAIGFADGAE